MYTLETETCCFLFHSILMLSTPTSILQRYGQKTHVCNCYTNRKMVAKPSDGAQRERGSALGFVCVCVCMNGWLRGLCA